MKKVIFILVPAFFLAIIFYLSFEYYVKTHVQKGALQVTASPDAKVYLNDRYIGQTPLCKCEGKDMVEKGEYTIRLVPVDNSISPFQEKITVSGGVLTVVDRKFGRDSLSSGSVISLTPLDDKSKTELLVVSLPSKSEVELDNNSIGLAPLLFKDPTVSDHILKVNKQGYKEKSIRVRTPQGYRLTVAVYLSTGITEENKKVNSPTPTSIVQVAKILILTTPTGFLRVRANATVGSAEVGRVNPGETYELLNEQGGWFQIKLQDGVSGWISNQYARKQ